MKQRYKHAHIFAHTHEYILYIVCIQKILCTYLHMQVLTCTQRYICKHAYTSTTHIRIKNMNICLTHTCGHTHSIHTPKGMRKKIQSTSPNMCLQFFLDVNTYNIYCAMVKLNLFKRRICNFSSLMCDGYVTEHIHQ